MNKRRFTRSALACAALLLAAITLVTLKIR